MVFVPKQQRKPTKPNSAKRTRGLHNYEIYGEQGVGTFTGRFPAQAAKKYGTRHAKNGLRQKISVRQKGSSDYQPYEIQTRPIPPHKLTTFALEHGMTLECVVKKLPNDSQRFVPWYSKMSETPENSDSEDNQND